MPDPQEAATFARSKLRWAEQTAPAHAPIRRLYRDLIHLRRAEPVYPVRDRANLTVAVAGAKAVLLRLGGTAPGARPLLVAVNLGETAHFDLADGAPGAAWELVLDTEDRAYGGHATATPAQGRVDLIGPRALVFRAAPEPGPRRAGG